jgi:hypothetical protein
LLIAQAVAIIEGPVFNATPALRRYW